jgi:AcrR family transcriptional regulator
MRAVATALGTSAGSLYRYLSSRDDLLDLMADRVTGELRPYPPSEGDWLDTMLLVARGQRALYRRHTWLLDLVQGPSGFGPESLAWFEHCLRVLEPVPCAATAKFEAIAMMTGVVSLFARSETTSRSGSFGHLEPGTYPHLEAALGQPPGPSPRQDLFERTLRILLAGLLVPEPADEA